MIRPVGFVWRAVTARPRLFAGVAAGLIAYPFLPNGSGQITKTITAWDIGVITYLVLALTLFITEDADRVEAAAEAQSEGQWTIFWLTLGASIASLAAILNEFSVMRSLAPEAKSFHVLLVVITLFMSWLLTHVTFTFRYAHEYYGPSQGGLSFPNQDRPDFLDFFYYSIVLGMTFQVSDVQITARRFRHLATVHGLLSFLFNTVILALTVNLSSGLL